MVNDKEKDLWVNRKIGDNNRYFILKRMSSGGMGSVYVATDTRLGSQVAIKVVKDSVLNIPTVRERFYREAQICAALKNEHIVRITDYGVTLEGHPFYVMEYLTGETLSDVLKRDRKLDPKEAINLAKQICMGLKEAHEGILINGEVIKVVHRDLKPENIFIISSSMGRMVKILDFGIAKKIREDSAQLTNLTVSFIGTYRYAAPEQFDPASNIDERADIYCIGLILYRLLSGLDPFGFSFRDSKPDTAWAWAHAHNTEPPIPLRSQENCEALPAELEVVAMKCLQKNPRDRYASVFKLMQDLDAILTNIVTPLSAPDSFLDPQLAPTVATTPKFPTFLMGRTEIPSELLTNYDQMKSSGLPFRLEQLQQNLLRVTRLVSMPNGSGANQSKINLKIVMIFLVPLLFLLSVFYLTFKPKSDIDLLKELYSKGHYQECIANAELISGADLMDNPSMKYAVQRILDECRLSYARTLFQSEKIVECLQETEKIKATSHVYADARLLFEECNVF